MVTAGKARGANMSWNVTSALHPRTPERHDAPPIWGHPTVRRKEEEWLSPRNPVRAVGVCSAGEPVEGLGEAGNDLLRENELLDQAPEQLVP